MALVDEAGLLRNQSQGLIGVSDQCLRPFKATLDEITLWPDPNSLLERATEVVSAETADRSEFGQRQVSIQMCFDVVIDTPKPLVGQPIQRSRRDRHRTAAKSRDLHCKCNVKRIRHESVEKMMLNVVCDGQHDSRNARIAKTVFRYKRTPSFLKNVKGKVSIGVGALQDLNGTP